MNIVKKIWVPTVIIVILAAFAGLVFYNSKIRPDKEIDTEIGYKPEDYITLGQYKGLEYEKQKTGVSDEDLQAAIDEELVDYREVDRASKEGDSLTIDFEGTVDGKKVDELTDTDYDIVIGDEDLVPEFDKTLVGKKAGDTVEVEVEDVTAFPVENADIYEGKTATFKVKVVKVSEEYTAELTDDWVKENYSEEGYNTVDEYKRMMRDYLLEESKDNVEESTQTDLWNKVLENCQMNGYPQDVYNDVVETDEADAAYWAEYWGMSKDEYYEFIGVDKDGVEKMYLDDVKSELVMWAIAKKENITISKSDIKQGYEDMYEEYDYDSAESMKADYSDEEIKHALVEKAVLDLVVDNAKIKEVPSKTAEEESK
jgi:trigger factor